MSNLQEYLLQKPFSDNLISLILASNSSFIVKPLVIYLVNFSLAHFLKFVPIFERALIFCGTGMGIHIAASKCPGVSAGVVESVPAALRAITGNGVNVLAMGAFYVAPKMGCDIADAYLSHNLGDGYEYWPNFYEFHKLACDELNAFNYEEYKANGFKVKHLGDYPLDLVDDPTLFGGKK